MPTHIDNNKDLSGNETNILKREKKKCNTLALRTFYPSCLFVFQFRGGLEHVSYFSEFEFLSSSITLEYRKDV